MVITMAEENIKVRLEVIQAEIDSLEAQKEPHVQAIAKLSDEVVARHFLITELKGLLPEEEPVVEPEPEPEPVEPAPEEEQPPSD